MNYIILLLAISTVSALEIPVQVIDGNLVTIDNESNNVFLVDTGATHSMVSTKYADNNNLKVSVVKGSIRSFHGKTDSVTIYKGVIGENGLSQLHREWLVVDLDGMIIGDKNVIGVLGMDLFDRLGAKIDLKNKIIMVE
jgi:hypothetical protein